jgi:DNA-binding NarL/FixJ family response regulator
MSETVKLLIVDDQVLFREALTTLLSVHDEFIVVGEAGDGFEAIRSIEQNNPDVVLMDLRMPVMDGVEATKQIHERFPDVKVIILTTFDDNDDVINALKSGAVGYLMKDVTSEKLFEAVKSAYRGEYFLQPSITAKVVSELSRIPNLNHRRDEVSHPDLIEALSPREMEILHLVAKGLNNKEIAGQLVITEGTVKNHLSNILGKLNARDRMQAVLRAREYGILDK